MKPSKFKLVPIVLGMILAGCNSSSGSSQNNESQVSPKAEVVTQQPTAVISQPAVVTPQPTKVTPQPAVVISQPEVVTPQPAVVTQQPSVQNNIESGNKTASDWNLNEWKLTLPISATYFKNNYGAGDDLRESSSAAELNPARCSKTAVLSANISLPYFEVDDEGHPHFIVDLGDDGISTTSNSHYARSEFRELYNYKTEDPCDSSKQNWKISDHAHHTLSATLNIKQYPDSSVTKKDPKVVVGQVHGYKIKQALVKLIWEGEKKSIRAVLNPEFVPGDKSCDCDTMSINLGKAKANTNWSYSIDVNDQGITLSAAGVTKSIKWGEDYDGDVLTRDWNSDSNSFYFKAGIYPQIKPKSSLQGQVFHVSFSKIAVLHN
ncbi:polysaccharide lyase family 7 protein [Vibrio rarus]|uniref:polysaccharide lyase family 7 protein n=1 Tax=Vibrio rarus TaxID=413403 RepID=UPI0021C44F2A|nr:polysaccharide lyase family 7 protein [Vibrio rarus]